MEKVKILGVGNKEKLNFILVKKNKYFFEWLAMVFYNSFEGMPNVEYKEYTDKNDNFIREKKKISKWIDKHETYDMDESRVEIFYGKEKVFIVIYTSLKNRRKLMKYLDKYSEFVEYNGDWKPKI